jgi:hypothetical protein
MLLLKASCCCSVCRLLSPPHLYYLPSEEHSTSYPSKSAVGLNPKTKSGQSARSRQYYTVWYFQISETLPDIWDVTRCWVSGFRRFEDRIAFVILFQLFLVSRTLQILGNTFFRNVGNHSPNDEM